MSKEVWYRMDTINCFFCCFMCDQYQIQAKYVILPSWLRLSPVVKRRSQMPKNSAEPMKKWTRLCKERYKYTSQSRFPVTQVTPSKSSSVSHERSNVVSDFVEKYRIHRGYMKLISRGVVPIALVALVRITISWIGSGRRLAWLFVCVISFFFFRHHDDGLMI